MGAADRHTARWTSYIRDCGALASFVEPMVVSGRVTRVAGLVMEAVGLKLPIGSSCVVSQEGLHPVEAEVVGFNGERLYLMPTSEIYGLTPGASVAPLQILAAPPQPGVRRHPARRSEDRSKSMPLGPALLGRIIDAAGCPLDRLGPVPEADRRPLHSRPVNPVDRAPIASALAVGVRAHGSALRRLAPSRGRQRRRVR